MHLHGLLRVEGVGDVAPRVVQSMAPTLLLGPSTVTARPLLPQLTHCCQAGHVTGTENLSGLVKYLKEEAIAEMSAARFNSEKMKSNGNGKR